MENKSLKIFVEEAIRAAMKKGEKERTITLRMLLHEIKTSEKIKKSSLDGSEISLITQKMIKQRKDSRSQFLSAGRDELAQKEEREIKTLSDFPSESVFLYCLFYCVLYKEFVKWLYQSHIHFP